MSKLYMMRHGQTLFNVLKRKQGWCDSPLTELGIEQAKRAGEELRERGITFDHAYSSTSERACDTLELVVPGMPYERVKGLKEWNFGKFEGITEDLNLTPPFGDFYVQFGGRTRWSSVTACSPPSPSLCVARTRERLMVSPRRRVRAISSCVRRRVTERLGRRIGNCGIFIYEFDGDSGFELLDAINPNE